jgi:hypothetical protein
MATFHPGDEVNDDRKMFSCYDTLTNANVIYDFNAAGYGANAPLNILGQGEVKLYGSTDPNFGSYITVVIAGTPTVASGIVMNRDAATNTGAYLTYNLPNTPGTIFYFKAILRKTSEANRVTIYWSHNTTS